MKSMRAQIYDAVVAAMKNTGIVDAKNVHVALDGEPVDYPALSVGDRGDQALEEDALTLRRSMEIAIVYDVVGGSGIDVTDKFNALTMSIQTIIGANSQWGGLAEITTLGDLAMELTPHAEMRSMTGGQTVNIQFTQNRFDPTKP